MLLQSCLYILRLVKHTISCSYYCAGMELCFEMQRLNLFELLNTVNVCLLQEQPQRNKTYVVKNTNSPGDIAQVFLCLVLLLGQSMCDV
ncbi:unnamed protein product, partial [Staurois parvus]